MTSTALLEHTAETIHIPVIDPTTATIPRRGGDVRVFDRNDMREVGSPGHPFARPSDILVTNGLVRFWLSPRNQIPWLNVSACAGDIWREMGTLWLADASRLVGARLVSLTPERATLALQVRDQGSIHVRLRRGSRSIGITHGTRRRPVANVSRYVAWKGRPPARNIAKANSAGAAFGTGMVLDTDGVLHEVWPADVGTAWDLALWWKPTAASSSLADAGLISLVDSAGAVIATLRWYASNKTLRWANGATVLSSAPLTFAAGNVVAIQLRQSAIGRTLTIKPAAGAVTHVVDAATLGQVAYISLGQVGETVTVSRYGVGHYGADTYGRPGIAGGTTAGGPIDNVMVLADALSDAEAATLAGSTTALGGLPLPQSRLRWYAPFDVPTFTPGSALALGGCVVYETDTDGGSTEVFHHGLSRSLSTRRPADKVPGLALRRTDTSWEVVASLASAGAGDTTTDALDQAMAASDQEVTVR